MMKVTEVVIFHNGMVVVFDENGKQIPELQGPIFEVMDKIGKAADENTKIHIAHSSASAREQLNVSWWFKNKRGTPPF